MKKEKQHYIPQFILRKWSDNDKSIRKILLNKGIGVNASIKNTSQVINLYEGNEFKLERRLSKFESEISEIISDIEKGERELSKRKNTVLKLFFIIQGYRNPDFEKSIDDGVMDSSFSRNIAKNFENGRDAIHKVTDYLLSIYEQGYFEGDPLGIRFMVLERMAFVPVVLTTANEFIMSNIYISGESKLIPGGSVQSVNVTLPISSKLAIGFLFCPAMLLDPKIDYPKYSLYSGLGPEFKEYLSRGITTKSSKHFMNPQQKIYLNTFNDQNLLEIKLNSDFTDFYNNRQAYEGICYFYSKTLDEKYIKELREKFSTVSASDYLYVDE